MISPGSTTPGTTAWKFYGHLRQHSPAILQQWRKERFSLSQEALLIGMAYSMYQKVAAFIEQHEAEVVTAVMTDNWVPIERIVFGNFPHYELLPSYHRALELAGVKTPTVPPEAPEPPKPTTEDVPDPPAPPAAGTPDSPPAPPTEEPAVPLWAHEFEQLGQKLDALINAWVQSWRERSKP